jgi:hypothetical protein
MIEELVYEKAINCTGRTQIENMDSNEIKLSANGKIN